MPSPSCWSASVTPTRSIEAANGPSVSEKPPRRSRASSGSVTSSSSRNCTVKTPNSDADTGRLTWSRVPPSKRMPVDVLPTRRDLERHFDVAAGQLAQERVALPSAMTSLPLRTVRRKTASSPDSSMP